MTRARILAVLAAGSLAVSLLAGVAAAQNTRAPAAPATGRGPDIALVDINKLFKSNERFKQQMNDMTKDVEQAENYFKTSRDKLKQMVELQKGYQPGSPDYQKLERDIITFRSDLNIEYEVKQKEFAKKRAKVYYGVYQEIQRAVDEYAAARGITAVLKFNSAVPDPEKMEEIQVELTANPFLWYDNRLDITADVQKMMERYYGGPSPHVSDNRGGTGVVTPGFRN